jgi:signal peptidase II
MPAEAVQGPKASARIFGYGKIRKQTLEREMVVRKFGKSIQHYGFLVGTAGLVVGLDQWTKALVRSRLSIGEVWAPIEEFASLLRIVHWSNTGAAFGLFPGAAMVFTVIAVLVSIAIIVYWPRVPHSEAGLKIALSLQLGGALGNLIDRLILGTVTDFIAVGEFPVFNVADSSISMGAAVLLIVTWLDERKRKKEKTAPLSEDAESKDSPLTVEQQND